MTDRVVILSPLDLKPGTQTPEGLIVKSANLLAQQGGESSSELVLVEVEYTNGGTQVFSWPSGAGWVVDGNIG